jgi:DNA repair protein RAD7
LEAFALCETPRFDLDCLKMLVEHCPNLKQLRLSRIVPLQDEWLLVISKLKHLQTLEISWPSPGQLISTSSMCELLNAVGSNLQELTIQSCEKLTDEVLTEAVLPTCSKLTTLNLSECDGFTSDGIKALFDGWVEQKSNFGLKDLNLTRCTKMNDEAIESVLRHSRKTLSAFSINSLDEVSSRALEAIAGEGDGASPCLSLRFFDCGFVRALDDIVMDKLVKSCNALEHLKVWGCHKLTECVPIRPGLRVEGRESDTS